MADQAGELEEYVFESGTVYRGPFKNGCFHGQGTLTFPGKGVYRGEWKNGQLLSGSYTFEDGLEHEETREWYCTAKDRRYYGEHLHGISPAKETLIRNEKRDYVEMAVGTYDCNEGYFDSETNQIHDFETGEPIRTPSAAETQLIKQRAYVHRSGPQEESKE